VNENCLKLIHIPPYVLKQVYLCPGTPVEVNGQMVTLPVNFGDTLKQILTIVNSPDQPLFLVLDAIEAATQPGVLYEVFVGLPKGVAPNSSSPFFVGTFSLFGLGVHDEAGHGFKPAMFRFSAKKVVAAVLREKGNVSVSVVPVNPDAPNGEGSGVKPRAILKIGTISFATGGAAAQ
jgi:hypothetical protein